MAISSGKKVGLVIYQGESGSFSSAGTRFYRYVHELCTRLPKNRYGLEVEKIENQASVIGRGMSIMFGMLARDLSEYRIIHNLDIAPLFPLRKGKTILLSTAHDFQFIFERDANKSLRNRYRDLLWSEVILRLSAKSLLSSDYLIAVSTLTKKDAIKLGYEKDRIFVVNHGVDERFFSASKAKIKKGKDFVVGYIGVFAPRKNVPFAIRAFNMIKEDGFVFKVWGKNSYDYDIAVKEAQGNSKVEFMGFAPDNKIVGIYDSFDVFVFPSMYEGFGIPIIEAQARGLPVIIMKKSKIPDEVRKYCLEADDEAHVAQLIKQLKEKGYDKNTRNRATEYARGFTWQRCADETLGVYREIMNRGM